MSQNINATLQQEFFIRELSSDGSAQLPGGYVEDDQFGYTPEDNSDRYRQVTQRDSATPYHAYGLTGREKISAINPQTSEVVWETHAQRGGDQSSARPSLEYLENTDEIYIAANGSHVFIDENTGVLNDEFRVDNISTRHYNFGDDGSFVAGYNDGSVDVFDSNRNHLYTIENELSNTVYTVAIDSNLSRVYVIDDNAIHQFDFATGDLQSTNNNESGNRDLIVDESTGEFYVANSNSVRKYDQTLTRQWSNSDSNGGTYRSIVKHSSGNIYVASDNSARVYEYRDSDGNIVNQNQLPPGTAQEIDYDSSGAIYVMYSGYSNSGDRRRIQKLNQDLSIFNGSTVTFEGNRTASGMDIDRSTDEIYYTDDRLETVVKLGTSLGAIQKHYSLPQPGEYENRIEYNANTDSVIIKYQRTVESRDALTGEREWSYNPEYKSGKRFDDRSEYDYRLEDLEVVNGRIYINYRYNKNPNNNQDRLFYIEELDASNGNSLNQVKTSGATFHSASYYNGANVRIYLSDNSGSITEYDESLNKLRRKDIDRLNNSRSMAVNADSVYHINGNSEGVIKLDRSTFQVSNYNGSYSSRPNKLKTGAGGQVVYVNQGSYARVHDKDDLRQLHGIHYTRGTNRRVYGFDYNETTGNAIIGRDGDAQLTKASPPDNPDNPDTFMSTIYLDDLYLNGDRHLADNEREFFEDVHLREGDSFSNNRRRGGFIVGVRVSDNNSFDVK